MLPLTVTGACRSGGEVEIDAALVAAFRLSMRRLRVMPVSPR